MLWYVNRKQQRRNDIENGKKKSNYKPKITKEPKVEQKYTGMFPCQN